MLFRRVDFVVLGPTPSLSPFAQLFSEPMISTQPLADEALFAAPVALAVDNFDDDDDGDFDDDLDDDDDYTLDDDDDYELDDEDYEYDDDLDELDDEDYDEDYDLDDEV